MKSLFKIINHSKGADFFEERCGEKEDLRITSDMGKLELAGQDIYNFRDGKEPYNNIGEDAQEKNEDLLEKNLMQD